jgi:isoquinoline 1-oxidoreductase alpha subunit
MIEFKLNGRDLRLDVDPDKPLLWAIREDAGLTGTKFGCGIGACGACTVHLNGTAVRSCITPLAAANGARITTIEGLSPEGEVHPVQAAWLAEQVPQCGYCQSGMIMAVSALLASNPRPSDDDINRGVTNICRCGTYVRIRRAIHRAAASGSVVMFDPADQQSAAAGEKVDG